MLLPFSESKSILLFTANAFAFANYDQKAQRS